jgi:hypothetical protein
MSGKEILSQLAQGSTSREGRASEGVSAAIPLFGFSLPGLSGNFGVYPTQIGEFCLVSLSMPS